MSTTELNISPLPWYDDGYRVHAATEDTDMRNGRVIFEYKHVDEPNDADYPFIVRAVNSHDDMLEALEDFLALHLSAAPGSPVGQAKTKARAAVEKARGIA